MKRKLPQWLLDATNNHDKTIKPNSTQSIRKHSSIRSPDNIANQSVRHSNTRNGTVTVVPLASLLSPSRGGAEINDPPIRNSNTLNDTGMDAHSPAPATTPMITTSLPITVKTEIIDPVEQSTVNETNERQIVVKQEVKDEQPVDSSNAPLQAPTLVPKVEDVKPGRLSCSYGIKCFRRNPGHRSELAHPGDVDYRRPDLPTAPIGTPPCPWGAACYRRNPQHFLQLSHPPATSTATVTVNAAAPQSNQPQQRSRNRNRNSRMVVDDDDVSDDDYDLQDPFIDDGSSDEYVPDEDEDDDDDDLCDTQEVTDN